jgi:hypothetical protein
MKDRIEVWDSATYQQWLTTNETNRVEWLQQFLGQ